MAALSQNYLHTFKANEMFSGISIWRVGKDGDREELFEAFQADFNYDFPPACRIFDVHYCYGRT